MKIKGQILNFLKYIKQKTLNTPRYQLTQRVKSYLCNKDIEMEPQDLKQIKKFLKHNLIEFFNYPFALKYTFRHVKVYYDQTQELFYLYTSSKKRLYFPKEIGEKRIKSIYNSLCKEQDPQSPHCYFFDSLNLTKELVVADIGVAEGNFSLEIVDQIKELYLFECDPSWIKALRATFAPWKEKVHIINSYVSNEDTANSITLNKYFQNIEAPFLIKADVEGYEAQVLEGASELLQQHKATELLICTYHKQGDWENLSEELEKYNYSISTSQGYMLFYSGEEGYLMQPPYDFRKALIHAKVI